MMLWMLLACTNTTASDSEHTEVSAEVVWDVSAEVSEGVANVVTVSFTTAPDVEATVRWEDQEQTSTGPEHEVLLLGLEAAAEVTYTIEVDGSVAAEGAVTTGSLPATLPRLRQAGDESAAPPYLLIPVAGATNGLVITDGLGQIVWYYEAEADRTMVRGFLAPDGSGVVAVMAMGGEDSSTGAVRWLDWHGELQQEVEFPALRMDAVMLPDGTVTGITAATSEGYDAYGDALVELSPDGEFTEVWNSWTTMDPELDDVEDIEPGLDWTHASALEYDPLEEDYYITLGYLSTLAKVDRSEGEIDWLLFGRHSEFSVEGEEMAGMHQIDLTEDGVLVFNNGMPNRGYSRPVEYVINEEARTAAEVWDYVPDPPLWVYVKGDTHRLDSGDTLVVWSSSGQVQIISQDDGVRWQLDVELGHVLLYSEVLDSLYQTQRGRSGE